MLFKELNVEVSAERISDDSAASNGTESSSECLRSQIRTMPVSFLRSLLRASLPIRSASQSSSHNAAKSCSRINCAIHANARSARRQDKMELTRRRHEIPFGILCIDPAFNGPAVNFQIALRERKRIAFGYGDHFFNQIHVRDHLGYGMLNLNARIHFHEIEVAVRTKQKLQAFRLRNS